MLKLNDLILKKWWIWLLIFWCFVDISLFVKLFWFTPNDGWLTVIYKLFCALILPKMVWSNIVGSLSIATNHHKNVCEFWFVSFLYAINLLFCSFYMVDEQDHSLYFWSGLLRLWFTCSIFLQAVHIYPGADQPTQSQTQTNQANNLAEFMRVFNEQLIANLHQAQRQANLNFPPPYSETLNSMDSSPNEHV